LYFLDVTVPVSPSTGQLAAVLYSFSLWTFCGSWLIAAAALRSPPLVAGAGLILVMLTTSQLVFKPLLEGW
jgi:hypothetical protein